MNKASNKSWVLLVIFAFLSVISFFQVQAYFWDSRGLNWIPITAGIVFGVSAIYNLVQVIRRDGTASGRKNDY